MNLATELLLSGIAIIFGIVILSIFLSKLVTASAGE